MELSAIAIWIGLPVVAGYIAHQKGRSWFAAVALTLAAPPLGLVMVLMQSPAVSTGRPSHKGSKILWGLLPLWIAIVAMVAGSFFVDHRDYWLAAPWLLLVAIPACAISLGLVEYFNSKGDKVKKR